MTTLNMPTLAILFDIDKIQEYVNSGNYLVGAWKVVWRAVGVNNLRKLSGSLLYECDTEGNKRGCCIAIQSMDESVLHYIRDSLSRNADYQKVAAMPMFLENESARMQPLMDAGKIDRTGNVIGDKAYCSAPAFESIKTEQSVITKNKGATKKWWNFWK